MELCSKYSLCLVLVPDTDGNDGVEGLARPGLLEDGDGQVDDVEWLSLLGSQTMLLGFTSCGFGSSLLGLPLPLCLDTLTTSSSSSSPLVSIMSLDGKYVSGPKP